MYFILIYRLRHCGYKIYFWFIYLAHITFPYAREGGRYEDKYSMKGSMG